MRLIVLDRDVAGQQTMLQGWRVISALDPAFPVLVPDHHSQTHGILIDGLTDDDLARLAFYEEPFGYEVHELTVAGAKAKLYMPHQQGFEAVQTWDFAALQASHAPLICAAAKDLYGGIADDPRGSGRAALRMMFTCRNRACVPNDPLADRQRSGAGK